jgi:acetylxylan esterase
MSAVLAVVALLFTGLAVSLAQSTPAAAAALTRVTSFGPNPSNINMYIYVPDNLAPRPALLVVPHWCTGTAQAMFDGVREFVTTADQYGYVIVYPEVTRSSRCWDVASPQALTRGGGSDPVGIMSMVSYTSERYDIDPARVYVSGVSSGAMMTNVLLAEYPDVFAAGAAFEGVPATCFATTDGSEWNSACANGNVIRTPEQWGAAARAMYPGYTGRYPRIQTWHGTEDDVLRYPNFGEQIKQWTNLHGLSQTPARTDSPQPSWTRTRYGSTGNQPAVEGISVTGAGHNLPQGGMIPYAIDFLGLRDGGPVTPPTTTPTATSTTPPTASACAVTNAINAWGTGLTSTITVRNTGTGAIDGWRLEFTLPSGQTITSGWNATYSPSSGAVTATNLSYNGQLAAGASVGIGFQATHSGNASGPSSFTLNGVHCAVG